MIYDVLLMAESECCMTNSPTHRQGNGGRWVRAGLVAAVLVALAGLGAAMLPGSGGDAALGMATTPVLRGPLTISVVESGTVRPREQIILKNELDDPATIVSIVDEGAMVKKGDLLVELDVTAAKKELVERRIRVQSAESGVVFAEENFKIAESQGQADIEQAELQYRFAQTDLQQYLTGTYPKLLKEAEATITIAEEELTRATEHLNWSNVLFEEKYLSRTALQQDQLSLKKAALAVELAKADLDLLKTHTHERQKLTFESNLQQTRLAVDRTRRKVAASMAQAEADLTSKKAMLEAERAELEEVEDEIVKSRLIAPIDGMVLYASSISEDWDDDEPRIDTGAVVDERGEIIYLPTTGAYNVDVKILEVSLRKVRVGQAVKIMVDAMPGRVFSGKVANIAPLPDAESRFLNPNLKLYNTVVEVAETDPALRNGMSCRVEVMVEHLPDAVHVPIQCVTRVNGMPMVHRVMAGQLVPTPVEIGLDNGRFVQIRAGVEPGEIVLLTPPITQDESSASQQEEAKDPSVEEERQASDKNSDSPRQRD